MNQQRAKMSASNCRYYYSQKYTLSGRFTSTISLHHPEFFHESSGAEKWSEVGHWECVCVYCKCVCAVMYVCELGGM